MSLLMLIWLMMFKFASWNIRGLNDLTKQDEVKKLISSNHLSLCGILETRVSRCNVVNVCNKVFYNWKWLSNSDMCSGGTRIVVGWDSSIIAVSFITQTDQVIHCRISFVTNPTKWFFCSFVYARNRHTQRRQLWDSLHMFGHLAQNSPWVVLGDFNAILSLCDSTHSTSAYSSSIAEFRDCVDSVCLEDLNRYGLNYTWTSKPQGDGGMLRKLDRVLVNPSFMAVDPNAFACFLPYGISDHSPGVVSIPNQISKKPKPFKFSNFIANNVNFLPLVQSCWQVNISGYEMFKLSSKLRNLKPGLRKLYREYGSLSNRVEFFRTELEAAQTALDMYPDNRDLREEEHHYLKAFGDAKRIELADLHQRAKISWYRDGDANTKYFHKYIKGNQVRRSIDSIRGQDGMWYDGPEISGQFVNHFRGILGVEANTVPISNPSTLFNKKLDDITAAHMVRDVTNVEIKEAIFDIGDDKAPGPDGFTACFFKKSWSIIGESVCLAIKEFFESGSLLKEWNATILSLIPKNNTPSVVADFRPISCCNVLYKVISKIITNRLRGSLDQLVDPNQSAFIPGRRISDNILLAQELMRGYHLNKGPPRCAFKVDIQKAYDTVSWSYMANILVHFGFHEKMINWIMQCISTAAFSININGQLHGFFKGKRGLRQGCPMSPFLFTLVMEVLNLLLKRSIEETGLFKYHRDCDRLKITHLCFADDLLIFSRGDIGSVQIIRDVLEEFKGVSGLTPSIPKSTAFMCNISTHVRNGILGILPFEEGVLPVRYLGVPLIATKLVRSDCMILVDKVQKRISDWRNKFLSFAGRLELINSVLSSMQIYWASVFIIPKSIIGQINRLLRNFLWNGGTPKVSWAKVCTPKNQGGLGIRNLDLWNVALMSTHLFHIVSNKNNLWVKWIHEHRLRGRSFWEVKTSQNSSSVWKKLLLLRPIVRKFFYHQLGDGKNTSFWVDWWCSSGPLQALVQSVDIKDSGIGLYDSVADSVVGREWKWHQGWVQRCQPLMDIQVPNLHQNRADRVCIKYNSSKLTEFTVKGMYEHLRDLGPVIPWTQAVWFYGNIPKHAFILWLAVLGRLATKDRLIQTRFVNQSIIAPNCVLCDQASEDHQHLFFDCPFAREVWAAFKGINRLHGVGDCLTDIMSGLLLPSSNSKLIRKTQGISLAAVTYAIWRERNQRIFNKRKRRVSEVVKGVREEIRLKLMSFQFNNVLEINHFRTLWGIPQREPD